MESNALVTNALFDNGIEACKGSTHNEQHVGGVDLNELLVRMLASTLWRNCGNGAFKNFEQCLLHAFARNVPSN